MTLHDFTWFAAGLSLGFAAGLSWLATEQRARRRQVDAIVAAYEAKIAEMRERTNGSTSIRWS